ncbi:DUF6597 domain-containing transcriptional factor [Antrihabitans stalagmiti]|uniref:DUF6597 domain-containing transcriptional factor n=1 Tax=Antrihabitans stalagmiti TaxID=2799499 RepID=UPI0035583FBE
MVYREYRPPADLVGVVSCVWEQLPAEAHRQRVVPDGCLDLTWLADRELVVAGADTAPRLAELPADVCTSGIRITPGAGGAVFGVPADELRDRQVDAHALWGSAADRLAAGLADASRAERLTLLAGAVTARTTPNNSLPLEGVRVRWTDDRRERSDWRRREASTMKAPERRERSELLPPVGRALRSVGRQSARRWLREPSAHDRRSTQAHRSESCPISERPCLTRCVA